MESLIHRTPSVGSVTKKIVMINPALTAMQIIDLIRQSVLVQEQSPMAGEFVTAEVIDEAKALRLAYATVAPVSAKAQAK